MVIMQESIKYFDFIKEKNLKNQEEIDLLLTNHLEYLIKNHHQVESYKIRWFYQFLEVSLPYVVYYLYSKKEGKIFYALKNLHLFPIDIQNAPLEILAKVPGISILCAKELFLLREKMKIDYIDIYRCGGKFFIAKHFICLNQKLLSPFILKSKKQKNIQQLELF
jgi:predicted DNA-binding helix-hairpin-helix protein